jgi:hypothetical protein
MARQESVCWHCGAVYAPARRADPPPMAAAEAAAERFDDDGGRPERPVPALIGA